MLEDGSIVAIASEGHNAESLDQTGEIVAAGKHVWYDKPAGDDWAQWQQVVAAAERKGLLIQMGYMLRYHSSFRMVAEWARSGLLGDVFAVRAHMSTNIDEAGRARIAGAHRGGIFFDLGGHMLDQVVWILGRPVKVTSFLRSDAGSAAAFEDKHAGGLRVRERPCLHRHRRAGDAAGGAPVSRCTAAGAAPSSSSPSSPACRSGSAWRKPGPATGRASQVVSVDGESRQRTYELELDAFLATIEGRQPRDRPVSHELLVQETLLRATGVIPD